MEKTKFCSYCLSRREKGIPEGCKHCVKGRKLVLFISGVCSRNCFYCSLSEKRKNKDIIWANERRCKNIREVIEEIKESNADSAGITGGDPLLHLGRTIKFAKELKMEFGKKFHIHIYLPTDLVTWEKLNRLSKVIDEIRFHPAFLSKATKNNLNEIIKKDLEKVKIALNFWKKENIGCELPLLPDKKESIFEFIRRATAFIGFVNLNEFEISDTNFDVVTRNYKLNKDTYTIAGSVESGKWILKQIEKEKLKIKVHVCTAKTKNVYQYLNRLKLHKILPYGKKTEDGTVIYLAISSGNLNNLRKELEKQGIKEIYFDKKKRRIILSPLAALKVLKMKKYKLIGVEEFPTHEALETECWEVK
jgi:hypothetical protein